MWLFLSQLVPFNFVSVHILHNPLSFFSGPSVDVHHALPQIPATSKANTIHWTQKRIKNNTGCFRDFSIILKDLAEFYLFSLLMIIFFDRENFSFHKWIKTYANIHKLNFLNLIKNISKCLCQHCIIRKQIDSIMILVRNLFVLNE